MNARPLDTSPEAWAMQRAILDRLGPAARVRMAVELSDVAREIQVTGLRARNPGWDERDAVRRLIELRHGVSLPDLP